MGHYAIAVKMHMQQYSCAGLMFVDSVSGVYITQNKEANRQTLPSRMHRRSRQHGQMYWKPVREKHQTNTQQRARSFAFSRFVEGGGKQ